MITMMDKKYDGESIIDLSRDVEEMHDGIDIPVDKHGIPRGTYHVRIEFEPELDPESEPKQ